jgi:hypothetical protein
MPLPQRKHQNLPQATQSGHRPCREQYIILIVIHVTHIWSIDLSQSYFFFCSSMPINIQFFELGELVDKRGDLSSYYFDLRDDNELYLPFCKRKKRSNMTSSVNNQNARESRIDGRCSWQLWPKLCWRSMKQQTWTKKASQIEIEMSLLSRAS